VFWRINLRENLQPGRKVLLDVDVLLIGRLQPFPASITQKEKQLVLFNGNAYIFSPYSITKQTTTITTGTKNLESFTKVKPSSQSDSKLVYGPYENVKPFSVESISVHYENNAPFLTVVEMERVLELSHWGNIAVEETITLEHKGNFTTSTTTK